MNIQLSQIIGTIQVHSSGRVWMIVKDKEFDILNDYLNGLQLAIYRNEQLALLKKLDEYYKVKSKEEQWNFFENEFGGNEMPNKKFGWLSLANYTPNLLLDKNTNELFIAYSIDDKFKIDKNSIISMIKNWGIIVEVLGQEKVKTAEGLDDKEELNLMVGRLKKYL